VEKPLAIDIAGLKAIVAEIKEISQKGNIPLTLMVGFNRRFSPHITKMKKLLDLRMGPACISYNVNPGYNSPDSWTQDPKVGGGRIIGEGCHFIDIIKFLVGKAIVSVYAQQVENFLDGVCDDKMSIMLKFADGSIGTVNYWANGATEYMKEQIFAFADTKILRMDNFQLTSGWGYRNFTRFKTSKSEKGHQEEVKAFCDLVRNGGNPLIAYEELLEVTLGTFMALESAKSNKIQLMSEWKNKLVSQN
jgi:predicted dehydrogenase